MTHTDGDCFYTEGQFNDGRELRLGTGFVSTDPTMPTMGITIRKPNESFTAYGEVFAIRGDDVFALMDHLDAIFGSARSLRKIEQAEEVESFHGTLLVDADGIDWVYNGHHDVWLSCEDGAQPRDLLGSESRPGGRSLAGAFYRGFDSAQRIVEKHGVNAERVPENHGAQFLDADCDLWVFNAYAATWYCVGDVESFDTGCYAEEALAPGPHWCASIYEGFEAVHKIAFNCGMAPLR